METVDINVKAEILNILKAFKAYCRQHDLSFVLAYGTLLGAVRHQGFIPWDDDVDVIMVQQDYQKLCTLAEQDPYLDEAHRYRITRPGEPDYCYPYIKVFDTRYRIREKNIAERYNHGLFIDVFRVDFWPESPLRETLQLRYARLMQDLNNICIRGNLQSRKHQVLDKLLKPVDLLYKLAGVTTERIVSRQARLGLKNKASAYMGCFADPGNAKERMPRHVYEESVMLPFEDEEFPVPKDYDTFLRLFYGDYWKLPDEKHRVGHAFDIRLAD